MTLPNQLTALTRDDIEAIRLAIVMTRPASTVDRLRAVSQHERSLFVVFEDDDPMAGIIYTRAVVFSEPDSNGQVFPGYQDLMMRPFDFRAVVDRVIKWHGLEIGLEFLPGSVRFPGVHAHKLRSGYGHLRGFFTTDDREAVDCYLHRRLIDNPDLAPTTLWRIIQLDLETGTRDEYKLMLGYESEAEAKAAYLAEMPSVDYFGGIHQISLDELEQERRTTEFEETLAAIAAGTYDFAAKSKTASGTTKQKKCTPGKSHFCQREGGAGTCLPMSKKCKYKPDEKVAEAAQYIGEKINGEKAAINPDFHALYDMAEGTAPDSIQLTAKEVANAKFFMGSYYSNSKKKARIQQVGNTTPEEAEALANWLGSKYPTMSKRIWNPQNTSDPDGGILAADILAAKALHKLPPVTTEVVTRQAALKGHDFEPSKPLQRWMKVDDPAAFVKQYQDALQGDGTLREQNFFGTSHLEAKQMGYFSSGANVIYKVNAKLDGSGKGRYVDNFKAGADEGEILYPPMTKFKVKSVTEPQGSLTTKQKKAVQFEKDYIWASEMASSINISVAAAYDFITGKKLPKNPASLLTEAGKVKSKQKGNTYIIELEEI